MLRNVVKAVHEREHPIRLFNVLSRAITTAPAAATFMGVYAGLACLWHRAQAQQEEQQQQQEHPRAVVAGAAGTAVSGERLSGRVTTSPRCGPTRIRAPTHVRRLAAYAARWQRWRPH